MSKISIAKMACGCRMYSDVGIDDHTTPHIDYCTLHSAASEMLKVLKRAALFIDDGSKNQTEARHEVEALIAKVEKG